MNIGFSGKIFSSRLSGNGYYLYRLLESLLALEDENCYTLFTPGNVRLPAGLEGHAKLTVTHPSISLNRKGLRAAFELLYVPYRFGRSNLDILHMPTDGGAYFAPGGKLAASLMGIAARHYPEIHPPHIRFMQQWNMALSARTAKLVFTISESSKKDLVEMFGISPDKIKVTPLGVDPTFYPRDQTQDQATTIRAKYKLPKRFILYVGNLEPRKNVSSLIQAFAKVRQREKIELVIAGRKAWMYDSVFAAAEQSGCRDQIHFTDYIDSPDLPWIYSMGEVFVFPSLFEGFGLPNLEAMACGTPVISSNISSIPEVVGDAGILIEPRNTEQIADAISLILNDRHLHDRLRQAGIARASQFTWQRTAEQTLSGYRELYEH